MREKWPHLFHMFPAIFATLIAGNYSTQWENSLITDIEYMRRNVPFYVAHANITMAAREVCRKAQEALDHCLLTKECNYMDLMKECQLMRAERLSDRILVMFKMMNDITVIVVAAIKAIVQIVWAALSLAWGD